MSFLEIINSIISFFQANLIIAIVVAILLIFLLWRKPKLFFLVLFIVLLLTGVLYMISDMSSTGVYHKQKLLQKEDLP
ncbi:MAG: hypothetical protein A2Z47_13825 [Thermodesulfovibrio sp. RBG_19FT_COMBO_42_12]|nr:MAG: hypothetical protein A2Z47_13825 [Thermodesulfovibrio sp. RBG_19FT_COMBO_42_12]